MSISSIGAYNVQALNQLYRLGSSGAQRQDSSSADYLIGEDSVSLSASAEMLSRMQGAGGFKADFEGLGDKIQAGDLEGAKQAFAAMQKKMQAMPKPGGSEAIESSFSELGKALDAGDTKGAQKAWKNLQTEFRRRLEGAAGVGMGSGQGGFQADFSALGELLDKGNLDEAKKAFRAMKKKLQAAAPPMNGGADKVKSAFESLGKALESGDSSTAKEAWTTLSRELEDKAAQGRVSTDGRINISDLEALLATQWHVGGTNAAQRTTE